jgi:hypothetical protein
MGAGEWSLDNAIDFSISGWGALAVTAILGVGGAVVQLATSFRPDKKS